MSAARPARTLVGRCFAGRTTAPSSTAIPAAAQQCLHFHSSTSRSKPRRSQFRNVKAEELGLLKPEKIQEYQAQHFPEYTPEEIDNLHKKYTSEQVEAILAGEKAVDPKDIIMQGRLRDDMFRPGYIEDFTKMDPRYDVKPEFTARPTEMHMHSEQQYIKNYYKEMEKFVDDAKSDQLRRAMMRALRKVKESDAGVDDIDLTHEELEELEKDPQALKKYLVQEDEDKRANKLEKPAEEEMKDYIPRRKAIELNDAIDKELDKEMKAIYQENNAAYIKPSKLDLIKDGPEGTISAGAVTQNDLGKIPGVEGMFKNQDEDPNDPDGDFEHLKTMTGFTVPEIKSLVVKVLTLRWVSNQTRLGKVRSTSALVIAGNGDGRLGLGMAKSTEQETAVETARGLALKNMQPIRRYENRTVYGDVTAKISGTVVHLQARPPGYGLRVPARLFEMCRAVGIHDLACQLPRSKSPMNTVKAVYKALLNQHDPEAMAMGRGKKLVDARKVYYGGAIS